MGDVKMKTIYLCGFMGCGKTTVGRMVARRLGTECTDLDKYIETQAGMTIPEIFEKYGEEHFRALETQALGAFEEGIIATGGGALLREENAKIARSRGKVIFIDTDFGTCYDRIKGDEHRPIVMRSTRDELLDIFNERRPIYRANSDMSIYGGMPAEAIALRILDSMGFYK